MQTSNDEALAFYKANGFEKGGELKGYYKRVEPPDAFLVSKKIARGKAAEGGSGGAPAAK